MDINSPEKSTGGFNKEHGTTLSGKMDLNAYKNKEGVAIGSLNYENEVPHDERDVYSNMGYIVPTMPLCEVNEGACSSLLESNAVGSSFPVIKSEEMIGAVEPNPGINVIHDKSLDYGIDGERSEIKDLQKNEVLEAGIDTGSNVYNSTEIEGLSCQLNDPLDKGENDHCSLMDRKCIEMHNVKMSVSDEVVNVDHGRLPVNFQPEKIEFNEERDYKICNLKSSHDVEVREDCHLADAVPSENIGMVWEHSSLQSPQRTQNVSSSERQLSVSAERSSHHQSPPKSPAFAKQEISSPSNFNSEQVPSPHSYRRHSPSVEKHSPLHERASSRDCSSPYVKRKSSSDRASRREAHHRDDSPKRRHSRSPEKHDSPRRGGRSASKSPLRRRYSPRNRRNRRHSHSRSPLTREHNLRSPSRRRSPRRRSPYYSGRRSPRRQWSPPPNRNTGIGKPGRNLYVAGFSYGTTERDLERKFSKFGRVTDVRVVRERRSGDSRGFGFLSLERDEDADAAIRAVDQTEWNGRIILVEKSKASSRRV